MTIKEKNKIEILLVEDNKYDAELTIRSLQKNNLANHVLWVKNGEEALDYLFGEGAYKEKDSNDKIKVVLLDVKMPKMDGFEVLKRIRADKRTKLLPVVMLTSSSEEKDILKSYKLKVSSYIVKPVEFQSFADAIRDIGFYWLLLNEPPVSEK